MTTGSFRRNFLRSVNCDGAHGIALLAGFALLLLPLAGGRGLLELWRYTRAGVAAGEWWRLLTAHVMHLDARHALFNAAGLALLWALFARTLRPWQWLVALLLILAVIDAGFWFVSTRLGWYVGASALLHGAFALGAVGMIRNDERLGWLAMLIFIGKLGWEQWQGPLPLTQGPVVTISHVYGAVGGALAGLLLRPRRGALY